jgi:uncharacterized protein YjbJ (UPF0337 family)
MLIDRFDGVPVMNDYERSTLKTSASGPRNHDPIKAQWLEVRSMLKKRWSRLTDADVNRHEGSREFLIGCLQDRYGIGMEQASLQVLAFERSLP